MKIERGSFSVGGNGVTTCILNDATLQVEEVEFFLASNGSSDTDNHLCLGFMSATQQQAISTFSDTTGEKSSVSNTKCIAHNTRSGGTITEIITANKPTNPFANVGEFDINFTANNSGYPIYFIARGN